MSLNNAFTDRYTKDSRQDSGHSNFSYGRYREKRFPQIYRYLYGDAMLVLIHMRINMETSRKICHWVLLQKREFISQRTQKKT